MCASLLSRQATESGRLQTGPKRRTLNPVPIELKHTGAFVFRWVTIMHEVTIHVNMEILTLPEVQLGRIFSHLPPSNV